MFHQNADCMSDDREVLSFPLQGQGLPEEGTFDSWEPDLPNTKEQFAMAYSALIVQRLLESEVSMSASSY